LCTTSEHDRFFSDHDQRNSALSTSSLRTSDCPSLPPYANKAGPSGMVATPHHPPSHPHPTVPLSPANRALTPPLRTLPRAQPGSALLQTHINSWTYSELAGRQSTGHCGRSEHLVERHQRRADVGIGGAAGAGLCGRWGLCEGVMGCWYSRRRVGKGK
jgi:hypothetical protein